MSQANYSTNTQAGKITLKQTKRGIEFHAFNHQRRKQIHIGTVAGAVYEKMAAVLRKPEESFLLNQAELGAIEEVGATFIRIIPIDRSGTYSISLQDFKRHGQAYYNASYGPQIRCALVWFSHTSEVQKRNSVTDNLAQEVAAPIIKPKVEQLGLFR